MKNAIVMPIVLIVTVLITMLIGAYMKGTSVNISKEFYRDLAEVRGYWGAYGAKELNVTNIQYQYSNYNIDVNKSNNSWEWNLTIPNGKTSGITNNDLYIRSIEANNTGTISYK